MSTQEPGGIRFDLERIVPSRMSEEDHLDHETLEIHRARYRFAARLAAALPAVRILDLACGVGYGTHILAEAVPSASVIGVDRDESAVAHARAHYAHPRIEFLRADAQEYAPTAPFDVVVSLETIEHVPDARRLLRRLVSHVRPGGLMIGSVPTTLSTDVNPHHLHDFTDAGFRRMYADAGLDVVESLEQRQDFSPIDVLRRGRRASGSSARDYGLRKNLARYYARHPAMLARRVTTVLQHGFCNKYLVLAGRVDK